MSLSTAFRGGGNTTAPWPVACRSSAESQKARTAVSLLTILPESARGVAALLLPERLARRLGLAPCTRQTRARPPDAAAPQGIIHI